MSNINLKRFVDIDIKYKPTHVVKSTRDTVVLLSSEGTTGTDNVFSSLKEFTDYVEAESLSMPTTSKYMKIFFDNGGIKIHLFEGITDATIASTIAALPNEEIIVAYTNPDLSNTSTYATFKNIAKTRNADNTIYGINQKLLIARTTDDLDEEIVPYFAVKLSSIVGAEMTMAAYLNQIDVYKTNSIADYAFTEELITSENSNDTVLGNCLTNNMNVDMLFSNKIRNLGGNAKDGNDLTNEYVLIILHQTITDRLLYTLTEKLKGSSGLAVIGTVISQELDRYVNSGYLSTDKTWTKPTYSIQYPESSGQAYTIIKQGEQLLLGYKVVILPYSSLTDSDKQLRKTPPIYVVISDAYSIRAITINGEVL